MPPKAKSRTAAASAASAKARKPTQDVLPAPLEQKGWKMVQDKSMGKLVAMSPGGKLYTPSSTAAPLQAARLPRGPRGRPGAPLGVADAKAEPEEAAAGYEPDHRVRLRVLRHRPH